MKKILQKIPCFQYKELMLIDRGKGVLLSDTVSQSLWLFSLGLQTAADKLFIHDSHITKRNLSWHLSFTFRFPRASLHSVNQEWIRHSSFLPLYFASDSPRALQVCEIILFPSFRILAQPFQTLVWKRKYHLLVTTMTELWHLSQHEWQKLSCFGNNLIFCPVLDDKHR